MFRFDPPRTLLTDNMRIVPQGQGCDSRQGTHAEQEVDAADACKMIYLSSKEERQCDMDEAQTKGMGIKRAGTRKMKTKVPGGFVPEKVEDLAEYNSAALQRFADTLSLLERPGNYRRSDVEFLIIDYFEKS
jgi:hypothetical protein